MKKEQEKIVALKGPDRVRKRPAVIFGSDGAEGVETAIKTLLDIFMTEAALGLSSGIDLAIHTDNSVSIRSHDRGFLLDESVIDGKPAWHYVFCEMYSGPRQADEEYYYSLGSHHNNLYGQTDTPMGKYQVDSDHIFDLCSVQYASKFMHVESVHDSYKKKLDFEKGYSVSETKKEITTDNSYTLIHFLADPEVFGDVNISSKPIASFLKNAAVTIHGLKCSVYDARTNEKQVFFYPNLTEDYAKERAANLSLPLFTRTIEARGKDRYNRSEYDAKIKLVLGFADGSGSAVCLHNYRELENGGEHFEALKEQLMKYINWEFLWDFKADDNASKKSIELRFDDIKNNVVLILETNCTKYASDYVNATKKAIKNRMITDMAHDLISVEFESYLKQNREEIFAILKDRKK